MQVIQTKFGKLVVEQSWADQSNLAHVARLAGGGYAHISGAPIKSEQELRGAIADKAELQRALEWFANRDNPETVRRGFKLSPDGNWTFDNGDPIENLGDILNNAAPGPAQDAMIKWMMAKQQAQDELTQERQTTIGKAAQKVVGQGKQEK